MASVATLAAVAAALWLQLRFHSRCGDLSLFRNWENELEGSGRGSSGGSGGGSGSGSGSGSGRCDKDRTIDATNGSALCVASNSSDRWIGDGQGSGRWGHHGAGHSDHAPDVSAIPRMLITT